MTFLYPPPPMLLRPHAASAAPWLCVIYGLGLLWAALTVLIEMLSAKPGDGDCGKLPEEDEGADEAPDVPGERR